jgi:hypothetical protein
VKGGSERGRYARDALLEQRIVRTLRDGALSPRDVSVALYGVGVSTATNIGIANVLRRMATRGVLIKSGAYATLTYQVPAASSPQKAAST